MHNANMSPATWSEWAEGAGAAALVSRQEQEGTKRSVISSVHASYGDGNSGTLTIRDNGVVVWTGMVHGSRDVGLGYRASHSVEAELAAGASGTTGRVALLGYTEAVYR